jgi:hypothetical protein
LIDCELLSKLGTWSIRAKVALIDQVPSFDKSSQNLIFSTKSQVLKKVQLIFNQIFVLTFSVYAAMRSTSNAYLFDIIVHLVDNSLYLSLSTKVQVFYFHTYKAQ